MDGSIASAVMLPEQEAESPQPPASPSGGHKRRQSSTTEQDPKRQRLSSIDANVHPDRRNSLADKPPISAAIPTGRGERGRERRLFGAALGALSQNSATAAQKRRSEIEKRQKNQRQVEEQENDQRKTERDAQRKVQRQIEQTRFEKNSMRIRHANLIYMAHFLQTETKPSLYYKPWETTGDQERRIQLQVVEAEETIRREQQNDCAENGTDGGGRHVSRSADAERNADALTPNGKDFHASSPQHQRRTANDGTINEEVPPKNLERSEDHAEGFANEAVSGGQAAGRQQDSTPVIDEASKDSPMDETGEEVVEAAEDTVIY